ncbi:MAG: hypothetical protein ABI584_01945, partial [Acidobacteriota bacterium]
MAEAPHEEEILGKAFEPRLVRRLFALARPYRRYAFGAVVVLFLESAAQLAGPLLTAAAIDLLFSKETTGAGGAARGVDGFFRFFGVDLHAGHG